jgi:hypothetical protein
LDPPFPATTGRFLVARYRAGERVIAGAVGGGGVDLPAFLEQIASDRQVPEGRSKREDRKSVRRITGREGRVLFNQLLHAIELPGGCGFVEF